MNFGEISAARVSGLGDLIPSTLGDELSQLIADLYPFCRSLTGDGVRATLQRLGKEIPLEITEVPTGAPVLDWFVPKEWNVRDAYIADSTGTRLVDFHDTNLHVLGYSTPVDSEMSFDELRPFLYSNPGLVDAVPYRTSYWVERWGFCLSHRVLAEMEARGGEARYRVVIDSTLDDGHLTYGESFLAGDSDDEILIHAHTCHPSLANDNLSGLAVAVALRQALELVPNRRFSYRFVFLPGTIGPITWLARNGDVVLRIRHGMVLSNVGDRKHLTFKLSQREDTEIDRAAGHVLSLWHEPGKTAPFSPFGYDERQYCSPGFDLAVGCLSRGIHGTFPEYHTSLDDCSFVKTENLVDSVKAVTAILGVLEGNDVYVNANPFGEPQLGRRGLYRSLSGTNVNPHRELAFLWVLNQSDGRRSLLDIAMRASLPFAVIREAADQLLAVDLLRVAPGAHANVRV